MSKKQTRKSEQLLLEKWRRLSEPDRETIHKLTFLLYEEGGPTYEVDPYRSILANLADVMWTNRIDVKLLTKSGERKKADAN